MVQDRSSQETDRRVSVDAGLSCVAKSSWFGGKRTKRRGRMRLKARHYGCGKAAAIESGAQKKRPGRAGARWTCFELSQTVLTLGLGSGRLRRRRRRFWCGRLRRGGCSGLDRIGLIVEAHNGRGDVGLRGGEENGGVVRRRTQNRDESV